MNWGYKIAFAYIVFALGLMSMVFMATRQEYHLVTEDYYQKELGHDSLMMAKRNSQLLEKSVALRYDQQLQGVLVTFPEDKVNIRGELHFYHTVNAHKDRLYSLDTLQQERLFIPRTELEAGRWKLRLSWRSMGRDYFDEKTLIIP